MVASQFLPVTGGDIALESIAPTGDDVADNVAIQTLDAFGRTVDTCSWNDWVAETACWVNDDFEEVTGVTFPAGQGLWVFGSSETAKRSIFASRLWNSNDLCAVHGVPCVEREIRLYKKNVPH